MRWYISLYNKFFPTKVNPPVFTSVQKTAPTVITIPVESSESPPVVSTKYSLRFDQFIPFIIEAETVYKKGHYGDDQFVLTEHDPDDSGGTTRYGIDKSSHKNIDVEHLTLEQAKDIYFTEWKSANIEEQYTYPLGECVFDCNVNAGASRTAKILAVTGKDVNQFLKERENFYRRLANSVPKNQKYLKGWINRITNLKTYLKLN